MNTQTNNCVKTLDGMTSRDMHVGRIDLLTHRSLQEYLTETELSPSRTTPFFMQSPAISCQKDARHDGIQITPIIQEAVRFLRATLPATIKIATTCDQTLPGVMIDENYIHHVLINLCTNAAHAMQRSGGRLEIAVTSKTLDVEAVKHIPDLKAGHYLVLSISDTGHGIDNKTLQHIFEPFYTTKKAGEGTGLGLFIVDYIISKHGGSVSVSSKLGQGTTCAIYLPAVE